MNKKIFMLLFMAGATAMAVAENDPIKYIERSWDSEKMEVVETERTCTSYTLISGQNANEWIGLENGWYVVKDANVTYQTMNILGNPHLILCDGARITLSGGVKLEGDRTLTIYGQTKDEGTLSSTNDDYNNTAGIGSAKETACGNLVVHGGHVFATGKNAAGIGGGFNANSGSVTVYGGRILATGGDSAAGIGGGQNCGIGGSVNIYGGNHRIWGGEYGAGIGGGNLGNQGGDVNIYGGTIITSGNYYVYGGFLGGGGGAGIGGGDEGNGGNVNISGGTVGAYGRGLAAGIGGGQNRGIAGDCKVQISGGTVDAYGFENSITFSGTSGAGIGGGQGGSQGGDVIITGGTVCAKGGKEAAGIGGGAYAGGGGQGGNVVITGGIVFAYCGDDCDPEGVGGCAIGRGKSGGNNGTLKIGKDHRVSAGTWDGGLSIVGCYDRENECKTSAVVKIEPCDHKEAFHAVYDGFTHRYHSCDHCLTQGGYEAHSYDEDGRCICKLVALQDGADNSALLEKWKGDQAVDVVLLGRTLYKDGSWNTLCLPFTSYVVPAQPLLKSAEIMILTSSSFNNETGALSLNFTKNKNPLIDPGTPYIIRWNNAEDSEIEVKNPVFTYSKITEETNPTVTDYVTFVGSYSPVSFGEGGDNTKLYVGSDNTLYYPSGPMTINAFRGYFQLTHGLTAGPTSGSAGIRAFEMNFDEDETGIDTVQDSGRQGDGSGWFTLNGRRLDGTPSAKGVYIHDGAKVCIK